MAPDYLGPRLALRLRFTDLTPARLAATRFTLLRFFTLRFVRFERRFAISFLLLGAGSVCSAGATSTWAVRRQAIQSFSFSLVGRYSSVMKEIPRRESASSSNFTPDFTISWISRCHCLAWNQG